MTDEEKNGLIFEKLLDESVRIHGHLCPGQVLGVRMSMFGLGKAGIADPRGKDRKSIMVYVEIDRCATDAIQSVTGCSLGKRTLKFMDYGKMAATFVNLGKRDAGTNRFRGVRVLAKEESRKTAMNYFPGIGDKYQRQTAAYKVMPDDELFAWREVLVEIPEEDMPGRPLQRIECGKCGEHVQDRREIRTGGKPLCRACAGGAYYEELR